MALIGKIREKSWLLLIVVGGAIVVFIFTSGGPNMGGGPEEEYGIGLMYGEKLDRDGFNNKMKEATEVAEMNARNTGQPPQEVNPDAVWGQFVEEEILNKEFEALGINVSEDEFDAYLYARNGFNPIPDLASNFKDAEGKFDAKALENQISQLKNSDDPSMKKAWEQSEEYYMNMRKRQKYFDILSQGMYVTNLEAKQEYYANAEKKSIEFVVLNYSKIDDASIDKNEKALKAFYKKHKDEAKYINRRSERIVRWADIKVVPSAKDSAVFEAKLESLVQGFKKTKNDSAFVVNNAGVERLPFVRKVGFRPEGSENSMAKQGFTYPRIMDSTFTNANVGDVIGPYDQNGSKRIAKVIGKGPLLSVRHILIGAQREDTVAVERAKKTVDSLMPLINADNFEQYVNQYSDDHQPNQPVANGGKYENFVSGEMVTEFEEFAKNNPVGTIDYVQTQFGFHIIEVLGREENVVPSLAVVQRTLKPSPETIANAETEAYELLGNMDAAIGKVNDNYKKVEKFDTLAKRADMTVRTMSILDDSPKVNGFSSEFAENELFRLAYAEDAQVGDIVQSPIKDGDRWVVAVLADIKVKGETSFENARRMIETEFVKEKKYRRLMAKMAGKSIEDIASAENVQPQSAEVVFGKSEIGRISREPAVVGAIFSGLSDGKMTQPLKGNAGVYVVKIQATKKADKVADYNTERNQLLATRKNQVQSGALNALKDMAEIIDNRRFSSIRIRN
jgi:peptidyl-prolyl cis-trans isomerase D